jgi:hypothetical protein
VVDKRDEASVKPFLQRRLWAFLSGVWRIFQDSQDEQEAREVLATLERLPTD